MLAVDWTQEAAAHLAWFRLARLALWQGKAEQDPKSKARPRQRPPSSTVQYSRTGTYLTFFLTGAHHSHKKLIHLLASPRLPQPQTTTREQEQRVQAPKYD